MKIVKVICVILASHEQCRTKEATKQKHINAYNWCCCHLFFNQQVLAYRMCRIHFSLSANCSKHFFVIKYSHDFDELNFKADIKASWSVYLFLQCITQCFSGVIFHRSQQAICTDPRKYCFYAGHSIGTIAIFGWRSAVLREAAWDDKSHVTVSG